MLSQDNSTQKPMVQARCSRNFTSSTLRSIPTSSIYFTDSLLTIPHPSNHPLLHIITASHLHRFTSSHLFTASPLHNIITSNRSPLCSNHHFTPPAFHITSASSAFHMIRCFAPSSLTVLLHINSPYPVIAASHEPRLRITSASCIVTLHHCPLAKHYLRVPHDHLTSQFHIITASHPGATGRCAPVCPASDPIGKNQP